MRHIFIIALLATTACGQVRETTRVGMVSEPNTAAKPSLLGTFDVSLTSTNPNCVWNDSTWTVEPTDDAAIYRVDTAAQLTYVPANDVPHGDGSLIWSDSRYYTVNGCYYSVGFSYRVMLDADGNLAGSVVVRPEATCGPATRCEYTLTSQRITDDAN